MLTVKDVPELVLSDHSIPSENEDDAFEIDYDIIDNYSKKHVDIAKSVFLIVLDDWMHGYNTIYSQRHYMPLFERILDLISKNKVIDFLLPGFPVKSPNCVSKVLGSHADFAEFLALRAFIKTIRKIEGLYTNGARLTIMSDYHIFDQYIGTTEEAYNSYHNDLKEMVHNAGADNIIKIINLTSFPAFQDTICTEIGSKLKKDYGNSEFLERFNEHIKEDSALLEKYKQMLKFMQKDQETNLPGSPRGRRSRKFLKEVATGMMSQGLALDTFLKEQEILSDYVRVSIHQHHPKSGKFPLDLFKQNSLKDDVLRTPWHHTVLFNTSKGEYIIAHKDHLLEGSLTEDKARVFTVTHKGGNWFLIKIFFSDHVDTNTDDILFDITMIKDGCGMMITNKSTNADIKSDIIEPTSLRSIIKEFGVVILRGFPPFKNEEDIFNYYSSHGSNGIIPWKFGSLHKVMPNKNMPGIVNETGDLPIHWDMIMPPRYMDISQSLYKYEDYTCREFLLYCKRNSASGIQGPTTLIDAYGATLSLHGKLKKEWTDLNLVYEISLTKKTRNELYFGGKGNTYEYPLIQTCPWTKKDVIRWCQLWTEDEHPGTSQIQHYEIKSLSNKEITISPKDLEERLKKIALDVRFFFSHNYEEGDQVFINNYTMLHGRHGFQNERELWRLQLIPPSANVPKYYTKHGKAFYHGDH